MNTPIRTLTGHDAIRLAENNTFTLRKYADPVDGAREVTIDEAREIAKADPTLIYATVQPTGWTGEPDMCAGFHADDYFDGRGNYKGPDCGGIEPTFSEADE